jgi:hypothetical protein
MRNKEELLGWSWSCSKILAEHENGVIPHHQASGILLGQITHSEADSACNRGYNYDERA